MEAPEHNPILVRAWRGDAVESIHRGSWALVEADGSLVEGVGVLEAAHFARSAVKSLQALPLFETGAAEHFAIDEREVALALASHSGEACHTSVVRGLLDRLGLGPEALRCGVQPPLDRATRAALADSGDEPTQLHNNCSGKHAGFLAVARHLGADVERYLEPDSPGQTLTRAAIAALSGAAPNTLVAAIDGCSAPTYRLTLPALATAFARVANPEGLSADRRAACRRMTDAVAAHPELVAGTKQRLCTDLARVTGGRLFPKVGAEAVYAIGHVGTNRGLAVKVDDGQQRALAPLVLALLERCGWLNADELDALAAWRAGPLVNWSGLVVGRLEAVPEGA
ncbi:MAG: asparaginase [Planctomycetota bacterium]